MKHPELQKEMLNLAIKVRLDEVKKTNQGETGILCWLLKVYPAPVYSGDIAEKMGIGTGRVGNALKSLEEKGVIIRSRDEEDKRKVLVSLTKQGYEKTKEAYLKTSSFLDDLIDTYGVEKMNQFLKSFNELSEIGRKLKERKEYEHIW